MKQRLQAELAMTEPCPTSRSEEDLERERAQKREQQAEAMIREVVAAAGEKYRDASISNFKTATDRQRKVRDAMIEYCTAIREHIQDGIGVLFYGPVGCGKDHLAMGVARAACKAGLTVKWLKGQEWFGSLRDSIESEVSERDWFRKWRCDVLVLSDPLPPVGPLTPYQASMLYRLVESRTSAGGVIVATINVASDEEADSRMGAQTWDRLRDRVWLVHCNWPSYRKPSKVV